MDKETLLQKLKQSERPTIVDFWAPWCVPCKRTKPILENFAQTFSSRVDFLAINTDENPNLMRELKILGIPTLLIVDHKKEISRITGAQTPDTYQRLFESLAAGEGTISIPLSSKERLIRLGLGAALVLSAWTYNTWWLLPVGLVVMFLGIYDRCPIWQAIKARFKRTN